MAPGRKSLRQLQIGKELVAGTSATPTVRLRFTDAVIEDGLELQELDEQIGILGGVDRTAIVKTFGKLSIGSQPISFEQLPYVLFMNGWASTTASYSIYSTGPDRVFLGTIPVTTSATPLTYTFLGGDDHEVERMTYVYCQKFVLDGKGGDVLKLAADFEGRAVTTASGFVTTANVNRIEDIVFSKGKVYLDSITGSFGATQVSNQVIAANVEFDANIVPKWTADGSLDFTQIVYVDQNVKGKITFEHDTAADGTVGAKLDWRVQTPKLLRLMWFGSQLTSAATGAVTTGNTVYGYKLLRIDLPIKWTKLDKISDDKGNDLITGSFRSRYDPANSTAGNGNVTVVLDCTAFATGTTYMVLP